jgi:predicted DNA-binding transcriptional regulator YafY
MTRPSKQETFDALRATFALAEERGSVPLTEAAREVGLDVDTLRDIVGPAVLIEFKTPDGEIVHGETAFVLFEDDTLAVDREHWLRDLAAVAPPPDAALRLLISGMTMQAVASAPTPDLDSAVAKLRSVVDTELRLPAERPPCLAVAQRASAVHRSLRFRYLSDGAEVAKEREVLPYRVFSNWGHWYVHARPVDELFPKYFRVDRMSDAVVGDVAFDPPEVDEIPVWFDLEASARTVRVRMRSDSLESLPAPHRLGEPTELGHGRVELDITVSGDRRLEHLLVCLDSDAQIVSPPEYAELRRAHAARLLAVFESAPESSV